MNRHLYAFFVIPVATLPVYAFGATQLDDGNSSKTTRSEDVSVVRHRPMKMDEVMPGEMKKEGMKKEAVMKGEMEKRKSMEEVLRKEESTMPENNAERQP
jgi:hypothetical protein